MVEISLPNFITIGLMSAVAIAVLTFALQYFGISTSWIGG